MSGRKVIAAAFGVVALFWAVFASAYIGGKIDANDVMRDEWLAGREALEEVAEDLLQRVDVSGVVGEAYRDGGAAYRYVFGERKFMSAEKRGRDAVLFVRKKVWVSSSACCTSGATDFPRSTTRASNGSIRAGTR